MRWRPGMIACCAAYVIFRPDTGAAYSDTAVHRKARYTHVVFSTFKHTEARSTIEANTRKCFDNMGGRIHTVWFNDTDIEQNAHGTPVLRDMYVRVFARFPDADTYTYANGDLLMDTGFLNTADAIVAAATEGSVSARFLVVGRRTNVKWNNDFDIRDFDAHFSTGTLFRPDAQDYFVVSKQTFDWRNIPAFVVGRPAYDNWLVNAAYHDPAIALIDATVTVRAIHQTDDEGNAAWGGPGRKDRFYNRGLGKGDWDHGTTYHAEFETFIEDGAIIGLRKRLAGGEAPKSNITQGGTISGQSVVKREIGTQTKPHIIILQINPTITSYCTLSKPSWERYANTHGYILHWIYKSRKDYHPKMQKYAEVLDMMAVLSHGATVLLSDCDVVVTNVSVTIDSIWAAAMAQSGPSVEFVVSRDPYWNKGVPINNGLMLMQASPWTQSLLRTVRDHPPLTNGAYGAKYGLVDQPILTKILIESNEINELGESKKHVAVLSQRRMNSFLRVGSEYTDDHPDSRWRKGDWVAHVTGMSNAKRGEIIKTLISVDSQIALRPTLVVAGTARNVAKHGDANLATIRRVATLFELVRVVLFEGDSIDGTLEQLQTWGTSLGVRVDVISESMTRGSRTVRLAHARNQLWRAMRSVPQPPDYVLMLDLDGVNEKLEGVMTCMQLPSGWGGCCANQRTTYYDLWALRTYDNWVNCDVWHECTINRKRRFRHVDRNSRPIKVRSCFGGAALYDFARVNPRAKYAGKAHGHDQCEHVGFHEQLGAPMYIQPAMLNDAPAEHIPRLV